MKKDTHTGSLFGGDDQPLKPGCEKCGRAKSSPSFGCTGPHPRSTRPPGEVARDEVLERVRENAGEDFTERVWGVLRRMKVGTLFTGETFRHMCEDAGIVAPTSESWGGVMANFWRSPLVRETGRLVKPKDVKSHASKKREYVRV